MAERLGDSPIAPTMVDVMNMLADVIDGTLNGEARGKHRQNGFILLVYPHGAEIDPANPDKHRCNYISNSKRDDVVQLLREQLLRFENMPRVKGNA